MAVGQSGRQGHDASHGRGACIASESDQLCAQVNLESPLFGLVSRPAYRPFCWGLAKGGAPCAKNSHLTVSSQSRWPGLFCFFRAWSLSQLAS
jgi:hypothetical protein